METFLWLGACCTVVALLYMVGGRHRLSGAFIAAGIIFSVAYLLFE